jgi:hypothetical protein
MFIQGTYVTYDDIPFKVIKVDFKNRKVQIEAGDRTEWIECKNAIKP